MEQLTEDVITGSCCELCFCYFKNVEEPQFLYEHGESVTCWQCWKDLTPAEKKVHKRAKVEVL